MTTGPGGDGAIMTLGFRGTGFETLMASKVLDVLAPELKFFTAKEHHQ